MPTIKSILEDAAKLKKAASGAADVVIDSAVSAKNQAGKEIDLAIEGGKALIKDVSNPLTADKAVKDFAGIASDTLIK